MDGQTADGIFVACIRPVFYYTHLPNKFKHFLKVNQKSGLLFYNSSLNEQVD